jgi:flagellar basal-body rod protein FlgB
MIQGLFRSTALPALEQTAIFAERRHEVLAGNVANLDTPGYRARDLSVSDFEKSLATAIDQDRNTKSVGYRRPGDFSPDRLDVDPYDGPRLAMEKLVYHDGSDVNWEKQVTEISKNQGMHNLAIAIMRSQFGTLNAAISERV